MHQEEVHLRTSIQSFYLSVQSTISHKPVSSIDFCQLSSDEYSKAIKMIGMHQEEGVFSSSEIHPGIQEL